MRGRQPREAQVSTVRTPVAAARPETPVEVDPELLERLKTWRRDRSREDNVPAYVVFSNRTLAGIVVRRPRTEDELLEVSGVGPTKLELYGEEVLEIVREGSSS
jgi:DNA helicase-2/ATP-dependent DNA helicase PcrA